MSQQLQKSLNPKMKQFLQHQQHQQQYLQTYQCILRLIFLEYHPPTKKGRGILAVELSEGYFGDDDDHSSDEDYEPSFNLSIRSNSRLVQLEDELDDDDIDQSEIELGPGIHRVRTADDIDGLVSDSPF